MATNKNAQLRYSILDKCFSNHYVQSTYDDLLENVNNKLEEYGYSIKLRQLKLDIKHMKSFYDFDLLEESKTNTWTKRPKKTFRYSDKDFSIYKKPITEIESKELKECLNTLNRIKGLPNFEWVNDMILKIDSTVNVNDSNKNIIGFEQNIYLKNIHYLTDLYFKILEKKVLELEYKPFDRESELLICHPYYLKQYNNRWFLFGWEESENYTGITNVALDRIIKISETIEDIIPNEVDWADYFDEMIGVSRPNDKEAVEVKLRFSAKRIPYVITKPIHGASQRLDRNDPEKRTVILNLLPNYEMYQAILAFGSDVEVLGPTEVIEKMKGFTETMNNFYN